MKTNRYFVTVTAVLLILFPVLITAQAAMGVRAGFRLSGLDAASPGAGSLSQPGIVISVPLEWRITKMLALQPELSYVQKGARWANTYVNYYGSGPLKVREEVRIGLQYLEATIPIKISGQQQKLVYFAGCGPYFGYRLAAHYIVNGRRVNEGVPSEQRKPSESPFQEPAGFDAGINFFGGWDIVLGPDWRITLEFQYQLGIRPAVESFLGGSYPTNRGGSFQIGFLRAIDPRKKISGKPKAFSHPLMQ